MQNKMNNRGMSSVIATVLIISITIVLVGIIFAFAVPFIQDSMKKAELCFDANKAIYIKSACYSINDGVLKNGPVWNATGIIGGAYKFYGNNGAGQNSPPPINSYIEVNNAPELNFGTNDFTLEAWIIPMLTSNQTIIAKWNGSGSYNQAYWLAIFQEKFAFGVYNLSNNNSYNIVYSLEDVRPNRIYYLIAERKQINNTYANISLYVNGVLDDSLIVPLFSIDNEETLKIGTDSPLNNPWYFNGIIDEVKIYNRALNESEIWQNYQDYSIDSEEKDMTDGLISYWSFDENTSGITKDSGNIKIQVSRGSEKIQLNNLLFIIKNKDKTILNEIRLDMQPYEEKQYSFAGLVGIKSIQIAPVVLDGAKEITCNPNPKFTNIGFC